MRKKTIHKPIGHEDGKPVFGRNDKGQPICNSPLRNKPGKRCQRTQGLGPAGRCRLHNGYPAILNENPRFKDGSTSKYLAFMPEQVQEVFEKFATDEDYLSLREDIGVARTSVAQQLAVLGEMDGEALKQLFKTADTAQELLDGEYDEGEVEEQLKALIAEVEGISELLTAGERLGKTQEHLRRLVETDARRIQGEQDQMPAIKVLALFKAYGDIMHSQVNSFLLWLGQAYPEVLTDPKFWNPLHSIVKESMALTGGVVIGELPEKIKPVSSEE